MIKKISVLTLIVVLIFNLVGCSIPVGNEQKYDKSDIDLSVCERNSEFAFDIFKELNNEESNNNLFISPLSISVALSMTYNGAEGKTKEDMAKALEYSEIDIEQINSTYKNLIPYLTQIDKSIDLNISNSIWYRQGEAIKEEFINTNKDSYNAEVNEIDFSKESAANTINDWIKESTKGKIEKMLNPPIPSNVVMYLINAVYYKGEWTEKFKEKNTFPTQFYNINNDQQEIKMMNRQGDVDYGEGDDFKAVKLPYGEEKVSMYFILPTGDNDVNDLINKLDNDKFNEIKNSIYETKDVVLNIPRFKLEYGIKNLNNVLTNMGMGSAFNEDANFSKIRENLFISRVLHKAVVEVNEEGSEAAGVTVVEVAESAIMEPISFIADKPFIFMIVDDETGTMLFIGKYCTVE